MYQRVAALPQGTVVAEFPIGDPAWELRYVYYASVHRKPIVNGYSGATSPAYESRLAALILFDFDAEGAWQALVDAGTTHVVLHVPAFADQKKAGRRRSWLESHGARVVERFDDGDVLYAMPAKP